VKENQKLSKYLIILGLFLTFFLFHLSSLSNFFMQSADAQGISENYPGDKGIDTDPSVVFWENFEEDTLEQMASRWNNHKPLDRLFFDSDVPQYSSGSKSLKMTAKQGSYTASDLYKNLAPGYERLYIRYYIKFPQNSYPLHHVSGIGGYDPPSNYENPTRARDKWFISQLEPYGSSWTWDFYTYWLDMRSDPNGGFWGNDFNPNPPIPVVKGNWICLEYMLKMNEIVNGTGSYNGQQTFWVDGEMKYDIGQEFPDGYWVWDSFYPDPSHTHQGTAPYEGFRWRNSSTLNINYLWFQYYVTYDAGVSYTPGQTDYALVDDLVLATSRIGCTVPGNLPDTKPPIRSERQPSGNLQAGTTQKELSLTTNENATCRFSTLLGTTFASMSAANSFASSDGRHHTFSISNLADGKSYSYYVRCQDKSDNLNVNDDDYTISFSISSDSGDNNTTGGTEGRENIVNNKGFSVSSGCGFTQFQWHFSYSILVIILAALALVIIERDKSRKT
jgi:hypothetical protein